jgi:hypothetical protein
VSEMADRVEQFANRFVPLVKIVTARLVRAQRWAEIDPHHIDAVAIRKEIAKVDPEFTHMLSDLVKIAQDCTSDIYRSEPVPSDLADDQRIATSMREMTAAIKECTKEEERYVALSDWVEVAKT